MNRDRQQKEQLVRRFEEIAPFLKNLQNFGWEIPPRNNPVYKLYADVSDPASSAFKPFWINIKTGWHSDYIYRDEKGAHRVKAGFSAPPETWVEEIHTPLDNPMFSHSISYRTAKEA